MMSGVLLRRCDNQQFQIFCRLCDQALDYHVDKSHSTRGSRPDLVSAPFACNPRRYLLRIPRLIAGAALAVLLLGGSVPAADPLQSGPPVGADNNRSGF